TPSISSTTTYYVEATSGACTSPRSAVVATINTAPTITGTTPAAICGTGAVTIGATASAGTISWYAAASGGTSLGTGTSFTSPVITSTTTYYAETTVGACTSARSAVVATINAIPSVTSTTPAANCGTGSVTLGATASSGTLETCTSPRSAVVATINTAPTITGTTPAAICGTGAVTIGATASAGTISWYAAASGGTSLGTGTSFTSPVITSTTTYYAETTVGACTSARTAVTATINTIPSVTSTTPAANCGTGSVTLGATASSGTLDWYAASSGGASLGTGTSYNTPSIAATTTYYVETSDGTCTSPRSAVVATINTAPTITGTTPAAICGTGAVTIGATASAGTISWYAAASGGTSLGTGTSFTTPVITSTTTYYAETTVGACTSARTAVTATINAIPSVTSTTPAANCGTGSVTLAATASSGTLDWYAASSGGASLGTGTTYNTPSISSTTTYYVETSNGTCTSPRSAVVATINTLPNVTANADGAICVGSNFALSASGANSYTWNNGLGIGANKTVNPVATTTYTVTGTALNGCQNTDVVTVTVNSLPTVDAGSDFAICDNDAVTLNGSGAVSYSWNNGVTNGTAFNPASTLTYIVTGTDANGCQNTDDVVITVNALPNVNAGTDAALCENTAIILNGSGANSYSWDNGVTNGLSFTPAVTATYTVTGTDVNGCQNTDQVIVSVNSLPTVNGGTDVTVCENTAVTLTASGATSYIWNNGVTNGVGFTPLATTTYTVTGTDANGCQNTDQVTVTVNAMPTVDAGSDFALCENDAVTLNGSGAVSYTWDNGVTDGIAFAPSATATYTVTGTDVNGCQNTDQVTISVNSLPVVDAGTDAAICENGTITLSGSGAVSYSWDNGVTDGIAFNPASSATYTVTGTDANGCQNTDAVTVTVNTLPTVDAGSDFALCENDAVTLTASGAVSYSWDNGVTDGIAFNPSATATYTVTGTDANGCENTDAVTITVNTLPIVDAGTDITLCTATSVTLNGSGALSYSWDNGITDGVSFTPSSTATYTVTGTDANGCQNTDQVVVSVNTLPAVDAGTDVAVCENGTVTLSGAGAASYSWDNGVTDGVSFTPLATATYTVTGTDANGCQNTDQVTVTVNTLPVVDAGLDAAICENGSVTLNGSGAVSYSWDNGVTDGIAFNPSATTTYTVTGTDANGCENTDVVTVTVNTLPAVDAGGDLAVCENGPVTLTGGGAVSYTWDNGVTDGDPFTPFITATYTVTGTDANNCQNTDQVTVTVNALPTVGAGLDLTVCENGSVTLSGTGADNYSWDNGITDGVAFNPSATNTYTVTGTDANGCQNTDQVVVSINALPTVFSTSPIEICKAEELTLTASSTASIIKWFDQAIGGNLLGEGNTLVISDVQSNSSVYVESFENGCSSARAQVDILVNDKPVIAVSSTNSDCGANNGTASASITQGTAPYFYYWSEGTQNQFDIANLPTGAYYFNVEDAKGCKAMAVTEVNPSAIQMNPTVINPSCFGAASGSISLDITGVSESIHYLWNTGHQTSGIFNLAAGTYEVTVTTESGCVLSSNFVLTQPTAIENTLVENAPSCGDNDGQISVQSTTGGNGPYLYSWSNGQFGLNNNNLTYGAYTLTTTDQAGCQVHNTVFLPEENAPIVEGVITQTACDGSTGAVDLDITPVNGDAVASIIWSNGATTEDISGLATGNYVSFITSVNNCVAVNAWSINIVQPNTQEICIVSVDSVTTTNLVVWEKAQLDGISHYNIYRESNQIDDYQLIDTVQFSNLSVFNDVVASPLARSWRYKISAVDFCGTEGPLSAHHKTLHLNTFDLGVSGVKITWDGYEGTAFSSYTLWRYTDEFGWEDVASLGTSTLTHTDPISFATPGLDYMVEISLDVPCTASTWRAQDFNRSRSNKERGLFRPGEGTGDSNNEIVEFENNVSLNVYPNPFSDVVTLNLEGTHAMNIQLFDIHGKLILENVYSEGENTVDLSNLQDGVYFIKTMINNESRTIKITKN
ncbi:MAG: hypothetical protein K0R65_801, partial [Crocinitomicaceae bacterium]|nr:hypothetical protein [Crocinitomicaceae bacterium]